MTSPQGACDVTSSDERSFGSCTLQQQQQQQQQQQVNESRNCAKTAANQTFVAGFYSREANATFDQMSHCQTGNNNNNNISKYYTTTTTSSSNRQSPPSYNNNNSSMEPGASDNEDGIIFSPLRQSPDNSLYARNIKDSTRSAASMTYHEDSFMPATRRSNQSALTGIYYTDQPPSAERNASFATATVMGESPERLVQCEADCYCQPQRWNPSSSVRQSDSSSSSSSGGCSPASYYDMQPCRWNPSLHSPPSSDALQQTAMERVGRFQQGRCQPWNLPQTSLTSSHEQQLQPGRATGHTTWRPLKCLSADHHDMERPYSSDDCQPWNNAFHIPATPPQFGGMDCRSEQQQFLQLPHTAPPSQLLAQRAYHGANNPAFPPRTCSPTTPPTTYYDIRQQQQQHADYFSQPRSPSNFYIESPCSQTNYYYNTPLRYSSSRPQQNYCSTGHVTPPPPPAAAAYTTTASLRLSLSMKMNISPRGESSSMSNFHHRSFNYPQNAPPQPENGFLGPETNYISFQRPTSGSHPNWMLQDCATKLTGYASCGGRGAKVQSDNARTPTRFHETIGTTPAGMAGGKIKTNMVRRRLSFSAGKPRRLQRGTDGMTTGGLRVRRSRRQRCFPASAAVSDSGDSTPSSSNQCAICAKQYARPSTLKTHLRTHSGQKPYRCSTCQKSFCQAANLTAHLRTHTGERPFSCPVCRRRFSQSSSVSTHLRTHSGEKPYCCQLCCKRFADSSTLTKHVRVHSGSKPYRCDICLLAFSQSGNLNRHKKVHLVTETR